MTVWLQFLVCVLLIGIAGVKLSRYGDAIADKTGLGGTWVGLILLASVTSLPELVTGVSSVTIANTPEIAVGDVLGSCVFNLLIIVILDFLHRGESVYRRASRGHILSGGFGVMLIGLAGFNILLASQGFVISFGHIGLYTPFIVFLYAVSVRTVYRYETAQVGEFAEAEADRYPQLSLRQAAFRYAAAALVVLAAGAWLPFVAREMALQMQWHESFVGTLFVAFVTSLPEVVVTVAALRLGAVDMAIGNLFGSNLFNILILAIDDLLYLPGPIFSAVAPAHAVSALSALMMTGVAIVGLLYRPGTRVLKTVGWASIFLFSIYLLNSYVLYLYGG
ncbi:MAG: sodium:calcium antiporter [Pseudomonadota bacterium]|nr:MAG: sodium:calcium antiporter [Pseudomonadota bacterium]